MSLRGGIGAAIASAGSIGVGASVGREGPAVHLGATCGAWLAERLHLTRSLSRALLGCGAAAAVAASFNAPIAGALFAHEVIVGHFALSAFSPIVIASLVGTIVSRGYFGDFPAFSGYEHSLASVWEFPAVIGLGILSGALAIIFMRTTMIAEDTAKRIPGPQWIRPAIGGFLVGLIALVLPQVMGVGYAATDAALNQSLTLQILFALVIAKTVATAISIGCGFGGGVFTPSLMIGAMLGGAYGILVTQIFPDYSAGAGAYTIIGMGGGGGGGFGRTDFDHTHCLRVNGRLCADNRRDGRCRHCLRDNAAISRQIIFQLADADDDLQTANKVIRDSGEHYIAVVENHDSMLFVGTLHETDVMLAYNRALMEVRAEEHNGTP